MKKRTALLKKILCIGGIVGALGSVTFSSFSVPAQAADLSGDSDYDGIDDIYDPSPENNTFGGILNTYYANSNVNFKMDYRWFFGDNSSYNPDLSTMSLLYAASMNGVNTVSIDGGTGGKAAAMSAYFGMKDVEDIRLSDYYNDNDLSEMVIAHREVSYNGEAKDILLMALRGTNSSIQEWSSNFDVGDISGFDSNSQWVTPKVHRGFDVTSQRIMKKTEEYISRYGLDKSKIVYWITGHSRGGALANVVGAYYENMGKKAFVYTFAAPNTTLDHTAGTYKSIFNIVNKDDFITYLPVEAWGYYKYGKSASVSISSDYSGEFRNLTGLRYDAQGESGRNKTLKSIAGMISGDPRTELYSYEGSGKSVNKTFWSDNTRANYLNKIPTCASAYSIDTLSGNRRAFWGSKFSSVQAPAFYLQLLASVLAGKTSYTDYIAIDVASRYESAKYAIVGTAISGAKKPHYEECYYILTKSLTQGNFR